MFRSLLPDDNTDLKVSPLTERRRRRQQRHQEFFQFVFNIIQAASIGGSMLHYTRTIETHSWSFVQCAYFGISVICFILWFISRIQLGTHLTFRAKAHRILVTSGLYKYFRHPIYYFGTLSLIFYVLFLEKYFYLWGLVILLPLQIVRASRENLVLKQKFENDYDRYVSKLWL